MWSEGRFEQKHPLERRAREESDLSLIERVSRDVPGGASIEDERAESEAREARSRAHLESANIAEILREYNVYAQCVERPDGLLEFERAAIPIARLPELGEKYALIGGAARALLLASLGRFAQEPRDIDIAYAGARDAHDEQEAQKISEKYMADDYGHGHGVQMLANDYFNTRDLTVNEVLATRDKVVCTRACLLDTLRNIVRMTGFAREEADDDFRMRAAGRAVRFVAEAIRRGHEAVLADTDSIKDIYIRPFYIALQLERAYELGEETAERFVEQSRDLGVLPAHVRDVADATEYLLYSTDFTFRSVPVSELLRERRWGQNQGAN